MKNSLLFIGVSLFATLAGYSQSWIKQESKTTANLYSVCFVNPDIGFVVGESGTILKTTNGGQEWQIKPSGTSNNLSKVHFINSLTGFAISYFEVFKTTDGGETWFIQDTVKNNAYFHDMHFIDKDTGFISGNTMLKTIDGGASWVKQTSLGGNFFSFWAADSRNMYIGADYFLIYKSIDGGENWTISNGQGFPVNMHDLCFRNLDTGYAIGDGFAQGTTRAVLLNTTNGGATWSDLLIMTGVGFNSVCFINDSTGFISGSKGTLLKTTDAGHHWITLESKTTEDLAKVFFTDPLTGYAVGANGTILKTTDGGINSVSQSEMDNRVNIFPNPVLDRLTIETKQIDFQGEISIYNIRGILIDKQIIAEAVTRLDLSKMTPGIYIVKVANNEYSKTFKLVKQ